MTKRRQHHDDQKKPKKQKKKKCETDANSVQITVEEMCDIDMLHSIMELILPSAEVRAFESLLADAVGNIRYPVVYTSGRDGRLYPDTGLQTCPKWAKHLLGHRYYHDVDITNCGPTFHAHLCTTLLGECPDIIKRHADDREGMISELRSLYPILVTDATTIKEALLCMYSGGGIPAVLSKIGLYLLIRKLTCYVN